MSRNLRHKTREPVVSKVTRRDSQTDASSDDDYGGVDLITDSEEDEPDVEVAEEEAIIASEEDDDGDDEDEDDAQTTPRPLNYDEDDDDDDEDDDSQESWRGFALEEQQSLGEGPFFDEHMARMTAPDHDTEAAVWNATQGTSEDDSFPETRRHVRFDLSDTSTTISDNEDEFFPDIFLEQSKLDPGFRRAIENDRDADDDAGSSENGSYWDFRGSDDNMAENSAGDDANQSESSFGSSGYETDEGETTEEDLPPAAKFVPARSVLRRLSSESSSEAEEIPVVRRKFRPAQHNGPKLASWVHDASKPFAVMDSRGKRLIMFKAKVARRYSFNGTDSSRPFSARGFLLEDSENDTPATAGGGRGGGGFDQMSPMISNSANLMMSAMCSPLDHILGSHQALGPPEAFYPFTNISADGTVTAQDSPSSYDDDDDDVDDEDLWNIGDFLELDDVSTDDGDEEEDSTDTAAAAAIAAQAEEDESCVSLVDNTAAATPASAANAEALQLPMSPPPPPSSTRARRPSTALDSSSEDQHQQVHPLLSHFQSGVVGAFRRNQTRHHLLSRNAASRDSLAFSGPLQHGTLRGIKGGRLAAVNAPMTPMRKSRSSFAAMNGGGGGGGGGDAPPSSPLAAAAAQSKKRKFGGEQLGHKRSRSMV